MADTVSAVLLAYNEAGTIEAEARSIQAAVIDRLPGSELIVAEDGSRDGTKEILSRLAPELGLRLVSGEKRKGYAAALRDALSLADRPWVFFMDSGGKHDPAEFWKLWAAREDRDLVVGVKTGRQDQAYRQLLTRGFNAVVNSYFGTNFTDIDSGFRLYRRPAVAKITARPWLNRDLVASEITLRAFHAGCRVGEVPISYRQRAGVSRGLPPGKIPGVIWRVLRNFPRLKRDLIRQGQ